MLLLALILAAAPASAQIVFTFSGDTTGDPTWNRPADTGDGTSGSCSLSGIGTAVPYETENFTVAADGEYAVETNYDGYDGYLLLYAGSFNPADQCQNLIALSDDFNGFGSSRIESVELTAATNYVAVVTGFGNDDSGAYTGFVEDLTGVEPPEDEAGDIVNEPAADATGDEQITGVIGQDADEDCYAISVTDASTFSADVTVFDPDGDSQLFLFDDDLNGVFGDDDSNGLLSTIDAAEFAAGGGTNGDYFLCITAFNNDPLNSDGEPIFPFGSTPPDPPSGDAVLASWSDLGFIDAPTSYQIELTGVGGSAGPRFDLTAEALSPLTVAPGGQVEFAYTVTNNTGADASGDLFFRARRGNTTVALSIIIRGTVAAGETVSGTFTQGVPTFAVPGPYTYTLSIGEFSNRSVDSETFTIIVTGETLREVASLDALRREAEATGDKRRLAEAIKAQAGSDNGIWAVANATRWATSSVAAQAASAVVASPNPFASRTTLAFEVEAAAHVRLAVYDLLGREVAVLVDGALEAGRHRAALDAGALAAGTYVYRLAAGEHVRTGRITLLD